MCIIKKHNFDFFYLVMSITIPPISTMKQQTNISAFGDFSAIILGKYLFVFSNQGKEFQFEFMVEIPDEGNVKVSINNSEYAEEHLIATFSKNSIIIIGMGEQKVLGAFLTNCVHLTWDLLGQKSFFSCSYNNIIEHCVLNTIDDKLHLGVLQTFKIDQEVSKLYTPKNSPNSLFVLATSGVIYHYSRSSSQKQMKFIRKFSLNDSENQIFDIISGPSDFLYLICNNRVYIYHINKFRISKVISVDVSFKYFLAAFKIEKYQYSLFMLSHNNSITEWVFDFDKLCFTPCQDSFIFPQIVSDSSQTLHPFRDGFLFVDNTPFIHFLKSQQKYFIVSSFMIPTYSPSMIPVALGLRCAFQNLNNNILVICGSDMKTELNIRPHRKIVSFGCPNAMVALYCTNKDLYAVSLKPNIFQKIIYSAKSENQKSTIIKNMKCSSKHVALLLGNDLVKVFSLSNYMIDGNIPVDQPSFFDIFSYDSSKYYVIYSQSKDIIQISTNDNSIIEIKCDATNYLCFIDYQGSPSVLTKTGKIITPKEEFSLFDSSNSAFYHHNSNTLAISHPARIVVYSLESKPITLHEFDEINSQIISFDGIFITILTSKNEIKFLSLHGFRKNTSLNDVSPKYSLIDHNELFKILLFESHMFSISDQITDEINETRYFLGLPIIPFPLLEGESTAKLYRNIFMSIAQGPAFQSNELLKCANQWEKEGRFINAAILYNFLSDFQNCAHCLTKMKKFELAIVYSKKHNIPSIFFKAAKKLAKMFHTKGDHMKAAAIFRDLNTLQVSRSMDNSFL